MFRPTALRSTICLTCSISTNNRNPPRRGLAVLRLSKQGRTAFLISNLAPSEVSQRKFSAVQVPHQPFAATLLSSHPDANYIAAVVRGGESHDEASGSFRIWRRVLRRVFSRVSLRLGLYWQLLRATVHGFRRPS